MTVLEKLREGRVLSIDQWGELFILTEQRDGHNCVGLSAEELRCLAFELLALSGEKSEDKR